MWVVYSLLYNSLMLFILLSHLSYFVLILELVQFYFSGNLLSYFFNLFFFTIYVQETKFLFFEWNFL